MVAEMLNTYYGERLAPEHMYTPAQSIPLSPPSGQSPPAEAISSSQHLLSGPCYPLVFQRPVWGHEHGFPYLPPSPPAYGPDAMPRTMNSPCPNPYSRGKDLDNASAHSGYFCPERSKTALCRSQHHTRKVTASRVEENGRGVADRPLTSSSERDSSSPKQTLSFNGNNLDIGQRVEHNSKRLSNRKLIQKSTVKNFSHLKTLAAPRNTSNGPDIVLPSDLDNEYNSCSPTSNGKSFGQTIVKQNTKGLEKPKKQFIPHSNDLPKDLRKPSPTSPATQPQSPPSAPIQGGVAADNSTPKGRRKTAAGVKRKGSVDEAAECPAQKCPKHEDQHVLAPGQSECLVWACKLCKQTAAKAAVKRKVATDRERERIKVLNVAFDVLKHVCGGSSPDPRQPKLEILQTAIKYIENLKGILHVTGCDWDGNESRSLSNSPYVNEPFQQYGEKSNLSSSSEYSQSSTNISSLDSLSQIVQSINPNTKSLLTAIAKNPENHER